MGETTVPDYPRGITFEQVWASIHELREYQRENQRILKESSEAALKAAEAARINAEAALKAIEADRKAAEEARKAWEEEARAEKATREAERKAAEEARKVEEARRETERKAEELRREAEKKAEKKAREKELNKIYGNLGIRLGGLVEDMIGPNLMKKLWAIGFRTFEVSRNRELSYGHKEKKYVEVDMLVEDNEKVLVVEVKTKANVNDVKDHVKRMLKMRIYADSKADKRKYFGAVGSMAFDKKAREYVFGCGFYLIEPSGDAFTITAPEGKYSLREW